MFDDLQEHMDRLKEFDFEEETKIIIDENSEYLSDLLKIQLAQGKDGKGENVTVFGRDYYAPKTKYKKRLFGIGLGEVTDRITNYMTGSFYQGIEVRPSGREFMFDSSVPYFEAIILQSGSRIMELNAEHLRIFSQDILEPQLEKRFHEYFNGL